MRRPRRWTECSDDGGRSLTGEIADETGPEDEAAKRERAIVDLAREYTDGRVGTPEQVRREFARTLGIKAILAEPQTGVAFDFGPAVAGAIRVTFTFRSLADLRRVLTAANVDLRVLDMGTAGGDFLRAAGPFALRDAWSRRRARRRDAKTVACALSLHYLSRVGGGRCTLEQAADLYDRVGLDLPSNWRGLRLAVLRQLRSELGPV